MGIVPQVKNGDIRQVLRTYVDSARGQLSQTGFEQLKSRLTDGGAISASERADAMAVLSSGLLDAAQVREFNQLLGLPVNQAPSLVSPDQKKLASAAVRGMKSILDVMPATNRGSLQAGIDHTVARSVSKTIIQAFVNVDPASAEGKKLQRAFSSLCEKSMYPVPPSDDGVLMGGKVVYSPTSDRRVPPKRPYAAMVASWVYESLASTNQTDRLPDDVTKFFR